MLRDFTYMAKHNVHVQYLGDVTYDRVPEYAARKILEAKAGEELERDE